MSIGSFDKSITSAEEFENVPRTISRVAGTFSDSVGIYFEPKITPCPIDRHQRSMTISEGLLRKTCLGRLASEGLPPSSDQQKSGDWHFRIML
jgi:hypothetical protein